MTIEIKKHVDDIYKIVTFAKSEESAKLLLEAYLVQIEAFGIRQCKECNSVFSKQTKWQKFCSEECKIAHHEAKHGRKFDPILYRNKRRCETTLQAIHVGEGILVKRKS